MKAAKVADILAHVTGRNWFEGHVAEPTNFCCPLQRRPAEVKLPFWIKHRCLD